MRHRVETIELPVPALGAIVGAAFAFTGADLVDDAAMVVVGVVLGAVFGFASTTLIAAFMRHRQRQVMAEEVAQRVDRDQLGGAAHERGIHLEAGDEPEDIAVRLVADEVSEERADRPVVEQVNEPYTVAEARDAVEAAVAGAEEAQPFEPEDADLETTGIEGAGSAGEVDVEEVIDLTTKDELYGIAAELDIAGRSSMTKAELAEAVAAEDPSAVERLVH